jgi:hypothetical protein
MWPSGRITGDRFHRLLPTLELSNEDRIKNGGYNFSKSCRESFTVSGRADDQRWSVAYPTSQAKRSVGLSGHSVVIDAIEMTPPG